MSTPEGGAPELEVTVQAKRSATSSGRRLALIALASVLPLILLVAMAQAMAPTGDDPVITNPHIHEASSYLHADGSILYYSDQMGLVPQEFELAGGADNVGPDDYVECARAFDCGPFTDTVATEWVCGAYTVTEDHTGNDVIQVTLMLSPTGAAYDYFFPYREDTFAPDSAAVPPLYYGEDPIPVPWSSSDTQAGVGRTFLYFRYGQETWDTQNNSSGTSGTFFFFPPVENVTYTFQTRAVDNVGNSEAYPSGEGDGHTVYDTIEPESFAESPGLTNLDTIPVTFTVDSDLSGLDYVRLYYRFQEGDWVSTAYTSAQSSGVLNFAADADGNYDFQTIAVDNAGNVESGPSGSGDDTTLRDTLPPTATVDSPATVASLSWQVSWEGHDPEPTSGIARYDVQFRLEGDDWQDWLTDTTLSAAPFGPTDPITVENNTDITFHARASDLAGNPGTWGPEAVTTVEVKYTYLPLVLRIVNRWDEYFEENDSFAQAYGPIQRGVQYRAYPDDRDDYYYFELPSAATVTIYVADFAPTSTSGDLILYDEGEQYIDQHGDPGKDFLAIDRWLEPGKYYVRVYTAEDYSTSQLYTLTVTW